MVKPVVVGVDGSPDACRAVCWAAAEAHSRRVPLSIVHAWVWPLYKVPLGPAAGAPPGAGLQAQADRVLADAAAQAREAAPDVEVTTSLVTGDAASRLVAASHDASLLVLGHRGLGGFSGLLLGSVGMSAAAHASCPVVVVRGRPDPEGPVVVGVDGPEHAPATIAAAFDMAHARSCPVVALHSFAVPPLHRGFADRVAGTSRPPLSYHDHLIAAEEDAKALVEAALAESREKFPDVPVETRLCDASAASDLVAASAAASLVVVGARGSGGFKGLVLGTTSHALIHHAQCPVMVVR